MAVSKPLLTEFGIDHRLESCVSLSWLLLKMAAKEPEVLYRINPPLPGYPTGRCVIVFVWHWIDVGNKDFFSGPDWPDGSDHHSSVRVLTVS